MKQATWPYPDLQNSLLVDRSNLLYKSSKLFPYLHLFTAKAEISINSMDVEEKIKLGARS